MGNVSVLKTYSRIFQMPYYQCCLIFYFKSVLLEILSYTDGTLSVLMSIEFPTWHHEHESQSHCGLNNDQQSNPWIRFWKSPTKRLSSIFIAVYVYLPLDVLKTFISTWDSNLIAQVSVLCGILCVTESECGIGDWF